MSNARVPARPGHAQAIVTRMGQDSVGGLVRSIERGWLANAPKITILQVMEVITDIHHLSDAVIIVMLTILIRMYRR